MTSYVLPQGAWKAPSDTTFIVLPDTLVRHRADAAEIITLIITIFVICIGVYSMLYYDCYSLLRVKRLLGIIHCNCDYWIAILDVEI